MQFHSLNYFIFKLTKCFLFSLFSFSWICATSQTTPILPPDSAVCAPQGVFTIQANYPSSFPIQTGSTNSLSYSLTSIPNLPLAPSGTSVILADDGFAGSFPIGFTFNFYGVNQTQFYISSNGYIGFSAPLPPYFNVDLSVLDSNPCNSSYPSNVIYGLFQDFNPAGLSNVIRYQTIGVAPNRILLISFTNLPFFGTTCSGVSSTFQIQLYETTNIIQVHISNKPACTNLWAGQMRSGLTPPCNANTSYNCGSYGLNGVDASITNKAWQYQPITSGSNLAATLIGTQWRCILGNGSNASISSTPNSAQVNLITAAQAPKRYIIEVTYSVPCGSNIVLRDTFILKLKQHNANFTVTSPICVGNSSTIIYAGGQSPPATASLVWDFDSGTSLPGTGLGPHTVNWSTPGVKTVSLKLSGGGCGTNIVSVPVDVNSVPTSEFNLSTNVCGGAPAQAVYIGNAPQSAVYNWDFDGGIALPTSGQGPFSIIWATPGIKNVRLTVSIGTCVSSETVHQVRVDPPPTSTFTLSALSACVGNLISLNYSGNASSTAVFNWDFDGGTPDGVPSTSNSSVMVNWSSSGSKSIRLSIVDFGCTSFVYTQNILILEMPSSQFTATNPICEGASTSVRYEGQEDSSAIFSWIFPAGLPSSENSIGPHTVVFPTEGTYFISLLVSKNGCNSAITQVPLVVTPRPSSGFTASNVVCLNGASSVQFTGSYDPSTIFNWNFDGGIANLDSGPGPFELSWSTSGSKTIGLSVVTMGCESIPDSITIEVLPLPDVDAGPDIEGCSGQVVEIGVPPIIGNTYLWSPENGLTDNSSSNTTVELINNTTSTQDVSLILVASNGQCSANDTVILQVQAKPNVSFVSPSGQCLKGNSFDLQAIGAFSSNALFNWSFDSTGTINPNNSSNPVQLHFSETGSHIIELQINDDGCMSNVFFSDVLVYSEPVADFTITGLEGCLPFKANFINQSIGEYNQTYTWDFGIGSPSFSENPSFVYEYPGSYSVSLIVESLFGCKDTLTKVNLISVLPTPRAGFYLSEAQTEILDPEITIVSDALNADTVWYEIPYFKSFYGPDQIVLFPDTGYFTVIQFVENSYGCRDTAQRIVYIRPSFRIFVPNTFTPNNDGINDILKVSGLEINTLRFTIYDRWGQQIYQSFDLENGWDGKSNTNNELIQNGVYYYQVELVDNSGLEHKLDGWVNLVR
jgi:gliding motility-associated-like protein